LAGFSDTDIWYEQLLRMIESRLRNACEIMLPSLRDALASFTQRADAIIRQLSQLSTKTGASVSDALGRIRGLSLLEKEQLLASVSQQFSNYQIALVDPAQIRPIRRRRTEKLQQVNVSDVRLSEQDQQRLYVRSVLENAFSVSDRDLREAFERLVAANASSANFAIEDVQDFIMTTQIVSMGANVGNHVTQFCVEATGETTSDAFFNHRDVFAVHKAEQKS
jgi:hypothetical protein